MSDKRYELFAPRGEPLALVMNFPAVPAAVMGLRAVREGLEMRTTTYFFNRNEQEVLLCPLGAEGGIALRTTLLEEDLDKVENLFNETLEFVPLEQFLVAILMIEDRCKVSVGERGPILFVPRSQSLMTN